MPTFRLLHASDLHFAAQPYLYGLPDSWPDVVRGRCPLSLVSSHDPDLAVAFAYFALNPPDEDGQDVIVLSGDLATTGRSADLQAARAFIDAPAAFGHLTAARAPTLRATPATVALLPGNHDRLGPPPAGVPHRPGNPNFNAVFQPYWHARPSGVQRLWSLDKDGVRLVLIAADFTLAANDHGNWVAFGWCGQGRAYAKRVTALRRETLKAHTDHPACVVVWVVHFKPYATRHWIELLESTRLLDAAEDEAVTAILCGHTHEPSQLVPPGAGLPVPLALGGSTTQYHAPQGNFLSLLDITVPAVNALPVITLRTFRYDAFVGQFI